jgi:RimJ/RimL family protein N-acetyltransferase
MIDELKSETVTIRPFALADANVIYELSQEKPLKTWIPDQVYKNENEAKEVLEYLISQYEAPLDTNSKPLVLAVIDSKSNKVIGHIGLSPYKDGTEIGYAVGEKFTGKGYCSEAVKLITDWALSNLDIESIFGIVASENTASYKVLEKSGYQKIEERDMNYLGIKRNCKVYRRSK